MKGTVSDIFVEKGYGFIVGEEDKVSRFFHADWCPPGMFTTLEKGAEVEFEPANHDRGPRALDVRPLVTKE